MEIITDCWEGVFSNEVSYLLENEDELIVAIDSLNGKNKTLIGLLISEDTYLSIGGGNKGRYVVTGNKGTSVFNLVNSSTESVKIEIVSGGQSGLYDGKFCVNKEMAIRAALVFYKNADFDRSLSWEILD